MTNQIINKLNKFQSNINLQHKQPVLAGKYLIQQNKKKINRDTLKKRSLEHYKNKGFVFHSSCSQLLLTYFAYLF